MEIEEEIELEAEYPECYPEVLKTVIYNDRRYKEIELMTKAPPKYHKVSQHNFHIKRYKRCLYCALGSEAVIDAEYEQKVKESKREKR